MTARFKPGDCVIYGKTKFSPHPGPNAITVWPTACGDSYSYCVPKYYRVVAVQADRQVVIVITKRGRQHTLAVNDPALKRASWWERLLLRHRFPPVPAS